MIVIENIAQDSAPVTFTIDGVGLHGLLFEDCAVKTRWLSLLGGCAEPEKGNIFFEKNGERLPVVTQRARIGYVPSPLVLYEDMTVLELLDFVAAAKGVLPDKRARQIKEVLELMGLTAHSHRLIAALSAQNRRRLCFAQAVLGNPVLIVCDDLLGEGGTEQKRDVEDLLRMLARYKPIVLGSTTADILPLCHDVTVIGREGVRYEGEAAALLAKLTVSATATTQISVAEYFGFSVEEKEDGACS